MAKQSYTTGQVLTSAQMQTLQSNDYNQTVSAKVASYVLVATDAGTRITMSNASATTITVNTSLFSAGDTLFLTNISTGVCTITAGTATVSTAGSLALSQYESGTLYFTSAGVSIFFGSNPGDITGVTAGTGISGGGTSGTVTVTNSMATEITAAGDIVVGTGSGTFDNLPIGTTAQVLTADTTVSPYKVKWATASSGMSLIVRTTYTSAATISVDGCFTSTYSSYVVVMENIGCVNATDSMRIKFRDSSGNLTASNYYGNALTTQHYNTTVTSTPSSALAYLTLTTGGMGGQGATTYGRAWYQFQGVGNSSENSTMFGNHYTTNNTQNNLFGGSYAASALVTGFQILSSGTNVAGTIAIYGLAEA